MKSNPDFRELFQSYKQRRSIIQQRLTEFAQVKPAMYFYELVYCLLTPQSSAKNAARAVEALKSADKNGVTISYAQILAKRDHYIRFHNTKAKYIRMAKDVFPTILAVLCMAVPSYEIREWLVKHVKGLGWKEASHFLRNIGHRNLAILDRHILKNLHRYGALRSIPKALTRKRYLAIERKLSDFAQGVGINADELDLLFWSSETGEVRK